MHKEFYASGFLYHPPTQQILLQQITDSSQWTLFTGKSKKEEDNVSFKKLVESLLRISIPVKAINSVYSYEHEKSGKNYSIFYGEIKKIPKFHPKRGIVCEWFTRKQLTKLNLTEQTRHDLTIGQRVIDAAARKTLGQKNLE